ncbi:putative two component response regulator [Desulfosarcina variabilis str. Montpellier]|uniref:7TMR-DISM family protein n=1 Tax=Desulfosarcina variabilis TaxID=2300 RepID=UPI003AFAEBCE
MKKKPIISIWATIYCGLVVLLVGIDVSAPVYAEDRFVITDETRHLVIDKGLRVHTTQAPLDAMDVADILHLSPWQPMALKDLNGKQLNGTVWLRFEVTNDSGADGSWLLEIGWPLLNHIRVVQYQHSRKAWSPLYQSGDMAPLAKRFAGHRYILFPLAFPSHERSTVYIGLESKQIMFLRLALWHSDAFWIHDRHDTFYLGVFFGVLAVMLLYNLSIYLFVRDSNYLFYSFYVLTIILYELAATGIGGRYIWHASAWLKQTAYFLFASASFLSATISIVAILIKLFWMNSIALTATANRFPWHCWISTISKKSTTPMDI